MFRSASARQSDLASHRLDFHMEKWVRTASNWFDGTPASVDERIIQLDNIVRHARDTVARIGSTTAGIKCGALLPDLEHTRRELAAARDSLLKGFADRQVSPLAGRRTASHTAAGLDEWDPYGYERAAIDAEDDEPAFRPGHEPDHAGQAHDFARQEQMERGNREWQDAVRGKQRDQYGDIVEGPTGHQHFQMGDDALSSWENGPGRNRPPGAEGFGDPRIKRPPLASLQRAIVLGSRDFVADQNTTDRDELLTRARRYAAEETSTLPIAMARRISAAFVGQVEELIARRPRKRQAAAPMTHYADFDDQLMY